MSIPGGMDVIDTIVSNAYILAAAATVGFAEITIREWSMTDAITTLGSTAVSWGFAISLVAIAIMWGTNDRTLSNMDGRQTLGVAALVGGHLAVEFVPGVHDWVVGSVWISGVALVVLGTGYYIIAYRW